MILILIFIISSIAPYRRPNCVANLNINALRRICLAINLVARNEQPAFARKYYLMVNVCAVNNVKSIAHHLEVKPLTSSTR